MLYYFDQAREARWNGTEVRATDEQHFSQGPGAVVLCTYHRSKGLEWPVVILASLDAAARADAFGVKIQSPEGPLDPEHPLQGRWIRYLPRPLSGQSKNLGFVQREEESAQGGEAREDERRERVRLLYVGFTRARDHLILAGKRKQDELKVQWLDELRGADGEPLLCLPVTETMEGGTLGIAGTATRVACRVWEIDPDQEQPAGPQNDTTQTMTWRRPTGSAARETFMITPSSAAECWRGLPRLKVQEVVRVGSPLSVQRTGPVDWAEFGDTVHALLAADRHQDGPAVRLERARRLLRACDSGASLEPEALIALSDALLAFANERWPGAVWHREAPIRVQIDSGAAARRVNGGIDLLLETSDRYVVIDHKTYGNPEEAVEKSKRSPSSLATSSGGCARLTRYP